MKRFFLLITALVLLMACTPKQDDSNSQVQKPRIPKKPAVSMQANVLGASRLQEERKEPDMEGLVGRINQQLEQQNITAEDIERGWYYGSEEDQKWGTPSSWMWVEDSTKSYWISPNALTKLEDIGKDELCRETAGYYVVSCIERELPHCEHIAQSECRCSMNSKWVDEQGCIAIDEEDQFVNLDPEDLKRGWYDGLASEKKLNTPSNWIWFENGKESRWQNPSPI